MPDVNLDLARFNMVNQQIRPWEVLDPQVVEVLEKVPRERFVPSGYRNLAFSAIEIPIGHGERTMFPAVEGRMLQSLAIGASDMVLEVGTGTGFITALLARLAKHVYSVEIHPDLLEGARGCLASLGISNVTLEQGDAAAGWDRHGPYDVIVLTGSVPEIPAAFLSNLRQGGRLFAVVGEPPVMEARLVTRVSEDAYAREDLFETVLPPLVNAIPSQRFLF
ncbi:protein-L-isoaspartate(D-aspartate) O-methyltransferase [Gammaproteobacteria bacterium]